ncbi:hypothetical protein FACS189425_02190 [Clostridia bacterium]|nr:hypothetical protein FACS189425_02190 [Clostridia bacterium]
MTDEFANRIADKLSGGAYSKEEIAFLSKQLAESEYVRQPLLNWLEIGREEDCYYENFSAFAFMTERGKSYPEALSNIAWLAEKPEEAKYFFSRKRDVIL